MSITSINTLRSQNRWWINEEAIYKDRYIAQKEASAAKWSPRIKHFFKFDEDVVYTLRGPRQVGKTTLVKELIKELIEKSRVNGRRIFYWTCDLISGPKELALLLETYIEWARKTFPADRLFIFLDEISSVKDWQKGIKFLVDTGRLQNCTLILTGSHSLDIRRASERLPGRRGKVADVLDKILLPMKFAEYIDVRHKGVREVILDLDLLARVNRQRILFSLADGEIPSEIEELNLYSTELLSLLDDYLITGGIATAIDSYVSRGEISPQVYETYIRVMLGDAMRWDKKETYMAQVVRRLIETMGTRVSWKALWKGTDLGSHHTVAEYVDVLESSFVVSIIYQLDRSKNAPDYSKDKKIHFQDPFLFHSLRSWVFSLDPYEASLEYLDDIENKARLLECVICNHLIRLAFALFPSSEYDYRRKVMYWKGRRDKEVDFTLKVDNKYVPIEVKFRKEIPKKELSGLYNFMKGGGSSKGIVITKDLLKSDKNLIFIPAYLFLVII